mmetsp:Transcript_58199/g.66440  ORF Transcript_58199/g.66440 Transcript_58199/m.66440 type:complete len:103 (-) Transcript_58199:56-364(-)
MQIPIFPHFSTHTSARSLVESICSASGRKEGRKEFLDFFFFSNIRNSRLFGSGRQEYHHVFYSNYDVSPHLSVEFDSVIATDTKGRSGLKENSGANSVLIEE